MAEVSNSSSSGYFQRAVDGLKNYYDGFKNFLSSKTSPQKTNKSSSVEDFNSCGDIWSTKDTSKIINNEGNSVFANQKAAYRCNDGTWAIMYFQPDGKFAGGEKYQTPEEMNENFKKPK